MTRTDLAVDRVECRVVAENGRPWLRKIANLALSIRMGKTDLTVAPIVAQVIDPAAAPGLFALRALGVDIVPTSAIRDRSPLNKIAMFQSADESRTLVALDCDLLVAADVLDRGHPGSVGVVPAEYPLLPEGTWRALYREFGLPLLDEPLTSTVSAEPIPVPYVNSGVIIMPGRWTRALSAAWVDYAERLRRHPAIADWGQRHDFHLEQMALACALSELALPLDILPVEYNAPFRVPDLNRVRVLHYHRQINDDGSVRRPPSSAGRVVVRDFNATLDRLGLTGTDWP